MCVVVGGGRSRARSAAACARRPRSRSRPRRPPPAWLPHSQRPHRPGPLPRPPDKFQARFGWRLAAADAQRVLARVTALSQALNAISASLPA